MKGTDLVVLLLRPASMYVGALSDIPEAQVWDENHPDNSLLPDILVRSDTRELLGVYYPLHVRAFEKEIRRVLNDLDSDIVKLHEHPVPPHLQGYGEGVPVLTISWSPIVNVDSEVAQLTHAAWFTNRAFWRKNRKYLAFALLNVDAVCEFNDLVMPTEFSIPTLQIQAIS